MMKIHQAVVIAGIASCTAFAAHAQGDRFSTLDRDGDGFVSQAEVAGIEGYAGALAEADDNRDGKLSPDEFTKAEAIHDRQQLGKYVDDGMLTAKVKTALLRERNLKSMDVNVESHRGRVLLSGFVESDAQRKQALLVASKVSGVREVKDGMTVK